jgi:hypothetical protein
LEIVCHHLDEALTPPHLRSAVQHQQRRIWAVPALGLPQVGNHGQIILPEWRDLNPEASEYGVRPQLSPTGDRLKLPIEENAVAHRLECELPEADRVEIEPGECRYYSRYHQPGGY